jgi:gamma-glutamylcyclotransferase (GGCT)/AIG2-like uncharacterized protein YtfP
MTRILFVYGTLKQGFPNHGHISSQRYLGVAQAAQKYAMYRYGSYPALVDDENSLHKIIGELYEVDESSLTHLDKVEGVDVGLFERKPITLEKTGFLPTFLSRMPLQQSSWDNISAEQPVVEAYFFRRNLGGAANCGSFWGIR